ncbi:hypothetical protein Pelo_12665 [Pelomyxa schiedti]|nr:hypothetical protein Pelo_12665 [Pelomyxa schiedti]
MPWYYCHTRYVPQRKCELLLEEGDVVNAVAARPEVAKSPGGATTAPAASTTTATTAATTSTAAAADADPAATAEADKQQAPAPSSTAEGKPPAPEGAGGNTNEGGGAEAKEEEGGGTATATVTVTGAGVGAGAGPGLEELLRDGGPDDDKVEWMFGEAGGRHGKFPKHVVQPVDCSTVDVAVVLYDWAQSAPGLFPSNFVSALPQTWKTAVATFDYLPTDPSHLRFTKGSTVLTFTDDPSGWAVGVYNGQKGVFPGNRVRVLEPLPPPVEPEKAPGDDDAISIGEEMVGSLGTRRTKGSIDNVNAGEALAVAVAAAAAVSDNENELPAEPVPPLPEFAESEEEASVYYERQSGGEESRDNSGSSEESGCHCSKRKNRRSCHCHCNCNNGLLSRHYKIKELEIALQEEVQARTHCQQEKRQLEALVEQANRQVRYEKERTRTLVSECEHLSRALKNTKVKMKQYSSIDSRMEQLSVKVSQDTNECQTSSDQIAFLQGQVQNLTDQLTNARNANAALEADLHLEKLNSKKLVTSIATLRDRLVAESLVSAPKNALNEPENFFSTLQSLQELTNSLVRELRVARDEVNSNQLLVQLRTSWEKELQRRKKLEKENERLHAALSALEKVPPLPSQPPPTLSASSPAHLQAQIKSLRARCLKEMHARSQVELQLTQMRKSVQSQNNKNS